MRALERPKRTVNWLCMAVSWPSMASKELKVLLASEGTAFSAVSKVPTCVMAEAITGLTVLSTPLIVLHCPLMALSTVLACPSCDCTEPIVVCTDDTCRHSEGHT